MTILLGLAAAASWGTSDFFGGLAGRRIQADLAATLAFASQFVGLVGFIVVAPLVGGDLTATDTWLSAGAGISGAAGIMFLYRGLAIGTMGVVAPITGALAAAIPAGVSPFIGEAPEPLAWVGIVLALVAIVVVAREPADRTVSDTTPDEQVESRNTAMILRMAVLAGCGFAGVGILLNATSDGSGLLALIPMKVVASVGLALLAWRRREPASEANDHWLLLLGAGLLDNAANVAYLYALRGGALAIAATLASLYPVGTTLWARFYLHERLARLQQAGFGIAIVAVIMIGLA